MNLPNNLCYNHTFGLSSLSMVEKRNVAVILQARLGSTRLPGKMLMPFSGQAPLLEVIIRRLKEGLPEYSIIVATTTSVKDVRITEVAKHLGVESFQGDENDVLQRFIDTAERSGATTIVRVCADNPFLLPEYIEQLISSFNPEELDYLSFAFKDGTPVIKSHIGLFTEVVTLNALRKVKKLTNEPLYLEHVTNYIYSHPKEFKIEFLPVPDVVRDRQDIRLTVDTLNDFEVARSIYSELGEDIGLSRLISCIDGNENYRSVMLKEIEQNSK